MFPKLDDDSRKGLQFVAALAVLLVMVNRGEGRDEADLAKCVEDASGAGEYLVAKVFD